MIPDDVIARVRDAARISDFIAAHVSLKKRGRSLLGLCPFHNEKTPSFSVNDERGFYHCFGCSAGGNVFKFLMEIEGLTFPESVRKVADRYGIDVPESSAGGPTAKAKAGLHEINASAARYYRRFLLESEHAEPFRDYIKSRELNDEICERYWVGAASPSGRGLAKWFAKEGIDLSDAVRLGLIINRDGHAFDRFRGRVMFPIRDPQGRVIGFGGRLIGDAEGPKYLNSPESDVYRKSRALYGLFESREAAREAAREDPGGNGSRGIERWALVEGYLDVLALAQNGMVGAVATCGTALTPDQSRILSRYAEDIVTVFDGDDAGRRAAARSFGVLLEAGVWGRGVLLPTNHDPDSFVREQGREAFDVLIDKAGTLCELYLDQMMHEVPNTTRAMASAGEEIARMIGKVSDAFQRDLLINKAAYVTGISEKLLRKEGRKHSEKSIAPSGRTEHIARGFDATVKPGAAGPEELLVSVLLRDSALIEMIQERDVINSMESGVWRELVSAMMTPTETDASDFLAMLPEPVRDRIATRLNDGVYDDAEVRRRIATDCIAKIEEAARKKHNSTLLSTLKKQASDDTEAAEDSLATWRPRGNSNA